MKFSFSIVIYFLLTSGIDWYYLGLEKHKTFEYYLDRKNIKVDENLRNVWVMFNYKNSESDVNSSVALNEYDCDAKKVRTNYLIQYSGTMATGEVLMTSSPPKDQDYWRSVEMGTVTEAIMKAVCAYDGKKPILHS